VDVPLLRDPAFYSRYLVALPLLVFAEVVVTTSLAVQTGFFLESGLVPASERSRYAEAQSELRQLYNSSAAPWAILLLAFAVVITLRTVLACGPGNSTWERVVAGESLRITPAGWWAIFVSLPVLGFLNLRWFWRTCVWAWFLYRVSRLALDLT